MPANDVFYDVAMRRLDEQIAPICNDELVTRIYDLLVDGYLIAAAIASRRSGRGRLFSDVWCVTLGHSSLNPVPVYSRLSAGYPARWTQMELCQEGRLDKRE